MGIAQLQANQPAEAIVNLQNALATNPDDADLIYYLSKAPAALSSEYSEKLLTQFSQTVRGHEMLGQNYYSAKMFSEAEKEYEKAITLRPNLPALHLELGEIYATGKRYAFEAAALAFLCYLCCYMQPGQRRLRGTRSKTL
jgi:predicted Zn-dependent protease